VIVDSHEDLPAVRSLRFPLILKGVYMKNHRFVASPGELEPAYEAFSRRFEGQTLERRAVAQEWIPGESACFGKLYVMCDQQSRIVASHTLRRLRVQTRRDGSQGDTLIAVTERIQPLIDAWLPFFEALRWVGMASMECKYDERDGLWKLIEINPRPWAILKVSVDCGVDIPWLYYRLAQGEHVPAQSAFQERRYYIRLLWGHRDWPEPAAVLAMLLTRRIGLREVLRVYAELLRNAGRVSVDVGRLRDPLPTLACMYYWGIRDFRGWF
jgi:predicted ATP-grasp superfamily ATP-dependent carboligase